MNDDLKTLAAAAAAVDAETAVEQPPKAEQGPAPEPFDPVREAREVVDFAVGMFAPAYPSLEKVWTPEARGNFAEVAGPMMQKYGLTLAEILEKWGVEIRFLMVGLPLAGATARAIRIDRAAASAASKDQAQASPT